MPSVESLTLTYDSVNEQGTFSEGDIVQGTATLNLSKQTTAQRFFIKLKGDANVRWTEKHGDTNKTYSAHVRYFKFKQFLTPEDSEETVLPEGIHVYKFRFQLPWTSMPSSYGGSYGRIVYKIEAKLCRSWRMNSCSEKEITFVSKTYPNFHLLMAQQSGSTHKEMGFFSKGQVDMDVVIDKQAYCAGDSISVVATVNNSSSKKVTPKVKIMKLKSYHARSKSRHSEDCVDRIVLDPVMQNCTETVKCEMKIPCDIKPSIQNCGIIELNYKLKVYLDISFASDPEVVFPLTILPPNFSPGHPVGGPVGPHVPASDFPPPGIPTGPYPMSPQGGGNGYPAVQGLSQQPPAYPGPPQVFPGPPQLYPNLPQQPSSYGPPSLSASSMTHPPPPVAGFSAFPSAPPMQPPQNCPSPAAPDPNAVPSAPVMNYNFLSQGDTAPPEYSVLFPSPTPDASETK